MVRGRNPAGHIGLPAATSCARPIKSQSTQTTAAVPSASSIGSISITQNRQQKRFTIKVPVDSPRSMMNPHERVSNPRDGCSGTAAPARVARAAI
jgi:hypothetical protein